MFNQEAKKNIFPLKRANFRENTKNLFFVSKKILRGLIEMIEIRNKKVFIDNAIVGGEERILSLLETEKKYKEILNTTFEKGDV